MSGPFQSIMSLFSPQNAQAQVQPPQTQNGTQAQAPNPAAQVPGTEVSQNAPQKVEEVSPLDAFAGVWDAPKQVEGATPEFNPSQIFNLDATKMQEALGKIDFTSSIQPAQLEAIQAGGPDAVKALMEVMNATSRQTMSHATTVTGKMIEQALTGATGAMERKVESVAKRHQVDAHLRETNPALTHPTTAPMAKLLQQQFTQQNPLASPAEINAKVAEYFAAVGDIASGRASKEQATQEATAKGATDWENYFTQ